jgi:hypothetical protein
VVLLHASWALQHSVCIFMQDEMWVEFFVCQDDFTTCSQTVSAASAALACRRVVLQHATQCDRAVGFTRI